MTEYRLSLVCPNREKARGVDRGEHDSIDVMTNQKWLFAKIAKKWRLAPCEKCGARLVPKKGRES